MTNLHTNHFELNTITIANKLNFAYSYDSANLEDKVDQYKYSSFEEWHPDFGALVIEAMEHYAKRLGFDPENWLAFHPKKIYAKGLLLKMDFDITVAGGSEIEVKGTFLDGLGELTQQIKGESLAYINGSKRKQGDLFQSADVILGHIPEPEPETEDPAQSDLEYESQPEPAAV